MCAHEAHVVVRSVQIRVLFCMSHAVADAPVVLPCLRFVTEEVVVFPAAGRS